MGAGSLYVGSVGFGLVWRGSVGDGLANGGSDCGCAAMLRVCSAIWRYASPIQRLGSFDSELAVALTRQLLVR